MRATRPISILALAAATAAFSSRFAAPPVGSHPPLAAPAVVPADSWPRLSNPSELQLRLRWLSILSSQRRLSLAVTGGVHNAVDAVKAVMSGAHAVQMASVLLRRGPEALRRIRADLKRWLEEHGYESLRQMQGSMSAGRGAALPAL